MQLAHFQHDVERLQPPVDAIRHAENLAAVGQNLCYAHRHMAGGSGRQGMVLSDLETLMTEAARLAAASGFDLEDIARLAVIGLEGKANATRGEHPES